MKQSNTPINEKTLGQAYQTATNFFVDFILIQQTALGKMSRPSHFNEENVFDWKHNCNGL
ncbi:hypothetical protein LR48_Vigan04g127800 [Vigna angularis]|uniref:Uncharacterized protein n=1 Tax=Phaseolus angularis TaxID=3914 RepID=A0A0L9UDT6_PHAAN|nr:hypothetical protein LR48_Vigan04g127800 [Vigna angularis]